MGDNLVEWTDELSKDVGHPLPEVLVEGLPLEGDPSLDFYYWGPAPGQTSRIISMERLRDTLMSKLKHLNRMNAQRFFKKSFKIAREFFRVVLVIPRDKEISRQTGTLPRGTENETTRSLGDIRFEGREIPEDEIRRIISSFDGAMHRVFHMIMRTSPESIQRAHLSRQMKLALYSSDVNTAEYDVIDREVLRETLFMRFINSPCVSLLRLLYKIVTSQAPLESGVAGANQIYPDASIVTLEADGGRTCEFIIEMKSGQLDQYLQSRPQVTGRLPGIGRVSFDNIRKQILSYALAGECEHCLVSDYECTIFFIFNFRGIVALESGKCVVPYRYFVTHAKDRKFPVAYVYAALLNNRLSMTTQQKATVREDCLGARDVLYANPR